jgi:phage FluMu protein Com
MGGEMPISLTCPKCSGKLRVADNLAGKKIKCPKCAAIVPVPASESASITAEATPAGPKGITADIPSREEMADEELVQPRRKARHIRRDSAAEAVSTIIPYKNGRALAAYYLGVFSLIPCLGLLLGPAALLLGILGLRYVQAHPTAKGTGHALAGVILGSLTTLGNWGVLIAMIVMGGIASLK